MNKLYTNFFKRVLDIVLSLILLPFILIACIIIAPIIFIEDKGPIFYNGKRLGKNGKVFKMYKFRSMIVDAPDIRNKDGSTFNSEKDPRLTKIGKFLRKTSIDELPQIINVLKGDMSFVGPRPHIITNYKGYNTLTKEKQQRLKIRPGITGYSQAYYRNSITSDEKIKNDIYYVNNVSLLLDIKIIIKTFVSVINRDNIYVSK